MFQFLVAICLFLLFPFLLLHTYQFRPNWPTHSQKNRLKRQSAITGPQFPQNRWNPNRPIAFFFDENLSEKVRRVIRAAAEFWQNYSCVSFEENGQIRPKVYFYRGNGCFGEVGEEIELAIPSDQNVSIGDNCGFFAPIAHEIGHVLGMIHTHIRADRDQFITIHAEYVPKGMEKDFERMASDNATNLGIEYDYGSVMQYTGYNQQNGKVIMEAKQPHYQHTMGNTYGPIFSDLLAVNRYFGCGRICLDVQSPLCQNGGFPNPKRCFECVCPNGFGGTDCAQRAPGEGGAEANCGETVQANGQWQTLGGAVEAQADDAQISAVGCHFHVKALAGQCIEIRVENLSGLCSPECNVGALEVKFERMTSSGARMCCKSHISELGVFTTEGPLAVISIYTQKGKRSFVLSHRTVSPSDAIPYAKWDVKASPIEESAFYPLPFPSNSPAGQCFDWSPNCANNQNACLMEQHKANMAKLCRKTCELCDGEESSSASAGTSAGLYETTTPKGTTTDERPKKCADLADGCDKIKYLCGEGTRTDGMANLCEKTCERCKERNN